MDSFIIRTVNSIRENGTRCVEVVLSRYYHEMALVTFIGTYACVSDAVDEVKDIYWCNYHIV